MPLGVGDIPLTATPGFMQGMLQGNAITQGALQNETSRLKNQYYAPNILSQIAYKNALTQGQNIENQYMPEKLQLANAYQALQNKFYGPNIQSEIGLRGAQTQQAQQEANKLKFLLDHPGFMAGEDAKTLEWLRMNGMASNPNTNAAPSQGNAFNAPSNVNAAPNNINMPTSSAPTNAVTSGPAVSAPPINSLQQQPTVNPAAPFNTGNPLWDAILNRRYAQPAYQAKMVQGFNWTHLPVESKNQLIAQGYGMGVEPLKMMDYVNKGMSLQDIAKAEGLDPLNLPPPIYPPTTETKTRVQQVQQVSREIDYLSSATTPIIKKYADTFLGVSGARLADMISNDPDAQTRYGEYIGALALQTGLANGRTIAEGGRPGATVMKMVRDSALKGIDQLSPIKMTGKAYEAAQNTIDRVLQRGVKIRTTTGMNPMSDIGKSHAKSEEGSSNSKPVKDMSTEEIQQELASLRNK